MTAPDPELLQRLNHALRLHRAGDLDQAEAIYAQVLSTRPQQPDTLHLYGLARLDRGDAVAAAEMISRAIDAAPDRAGYHNDLGEALRELEQFEAAAQAYGRALELAPGEAGGYINLGNVLQRLGRLPEALELYDRALGLGLAGPELHYNRGNALDKAGRYAEAAESYRQAIALDPGFDRAHANLGAVLQGQGRTLEALAAMDEALRLAPDVLSRRRDRRELIARLVPDWHFPMMNDSLRNAAYARALARHVTPDTHVLEIGTGSGLLAMLAARAGAAHVTTCEAVPPIAEAARRIIAANGLSDRITVIAKPSTALEIGIDLPGRADLLVSEILSSEFIGEGVLGAIAHARQSLLVTGARSIPLGGAAIGCLVGGEELEHHCFAGMVEGFDLSAFNALATPVLPLRLPDFRCDYLSEAVEIARYELSQHGLRPDRRELAFPVTRPGRCVGVAQWIAIDLDEQERFDNDPRRDIGRASSGWQHLLYTLEQPVEVRPGQVLTVAVEETPGRLLIDLPRLSSPA